MTMQLAITDGGGGVDGSDDNNDDGDDDFGDCYLHEVDGDWLN